MKNYARLFAIIFIGVLAPLFFTSCESEEMSSTEELTQTDKPTSSIAAEPILTAISFDELNNVLGKNKEYQQISKRFELEKLALKRSNANGKSESVPTIQKTEVNDYTTYTLALEKDQPRIIKNLVFQEKDGKLQAELLTYDLSQKGSYNPTADAFEVGNISRESLTNNQAEDFIGKNSCSTINVGYPVPCNGIINGQDANHLPGDHCSASQQPYYLWIPMNVCFGSPGDWNSTTLQIPRCEVSESCSGVPNGGGGGGSTGGGLDGPGNPLTDPDGTESPYLAAYEGLISYLDYNLSISNSANHYLHQNLRELGPQIAKVLEDYGTSSGVQRGIELLLNLDKDIKQGKLSTDNANRIGQFLRNNQFSSESVGYANNLNLIAQNKFLSTRPTFTQIIDHKREVTRLANYLERFGDPEDKEMGKYLNALVPEFDKMGVGDVKDIYKLANELAKNVGNKYVNGLIFTLAEAAYPFIVYALTEATLGAALPILNRLPSLLKNSRITKIIANLVSNSKFGNLKHAKKFGIDTYSGLNATLRALKINKNEAGIHVHHLIEQRFKEIMKNILGSDPNKWKSVVLTKAEHQVFTNAWRQRIGYANDNVLLTTSNATKEQVLAAARDIYKNYPEILKILGL